MEPWRPQRHPEDLSIAIERAFAGGMALRRSTAAWLRPTPGGFSLESSLERVMRAYG